MRPHRKPRPVEALIRGETPDDRQVLLALQVDQTMHMVEAMAGVVMAFAYAWRDEAAADPKMEKMPKPLHDAFTRLDAAMNGGQQS